MSLFGAILGSILVARLGLLMALFITGIGQLMGNLIFAVLAVASKGLPLLKLTNAVETLTGAMATAAFVAFLSSLCNVHFTATQYALLTFLTAQVRPLFAAGGGWLADQLGWLAFFLATIVTAFPGLILLVWLIYQTKGETNPKHL